MELVSCPHCRVTVAPTVQGQCPSCRNMLDPEGGDVANPYRSPETAATVDTPTKPSKANSPEAQLALAHRGMMWSLIAKISVDMFVTMSQELFSPPFLLLFWIVYAVAAVFMMIFVFRVANYLYGAGPGGICAMLTLFPCLGVFVALMLSGQAMDSLRKAGLPAGFFGVTNEQLRKAQDKKDV